MRRALGLLAVACAGSLVAALACGIPVSGLEADDDGGGGVADSSTVDSGRGRDATVDATGDAARDGAPRDTSSADDVDAPACARPPCAVDLARS